MALTMTRIRTQTALTKLATLLADINGELAFVETLLETTRDHRDFLMARKEKLNGQRLALCEALKQFDASIDPGRLTT